MPILCTVVSGEKLGRQIGFPTANLEPVDRFVDYQKGVYAVRVRHKNKVYYGVMNLGIRPTVASGRFTAEVHILDFTNDIYGEELEIEMITYIRNERKFNSLQALQSQISADISFTRNLLNVAQPGRKGS